MADSFAHLAAKSHSHAGYSLIFFVRPLDIVREIMEHLPFIFHFAGEIMEYQYKNFHSMSENAIINRLEKQMVPRKARGEILAAVRAEKKHARSVGAKLLQHRRLWEELCDPLHYELRLVRRMIAYDGPTERAEALQAYLYCLERVFAKLVSASETSALMPTELAKEEQIPNNGVHWSDWVKPKVKETVIELFSYIPRAGVKVKTPFERKVPAGLYAKLKKRLLQRTQKEYDNEYRKQSVDYTEARDSQLKRMKNALQWIQDSAEGEALPTTWHGFYK